jgi:hypothetical protein
MAFMRQMNTIDIAHSSSTYEVRQVKYVLRAFEVSVPDLERDLMLRTVCQVVPQLFEAGSRHLAYLQTKGTRPSPPRNI